MLDDSSKSVLCAAMCALEEVAFAGDQSVIGALIALLTAVLKQAIREFSRNFRQVFASFRKLFATFGARNGSKMIQNDSKRRKTARTWCETVTDP